MQRALLIADDRLSASRTRRTREESQKLSRPNPLNTAVTIDYHSDLAIFVIVLQTVIKSGVQSHQNRRSLEVHWMNRNRPLARCAHRAPLCKQFACKVMSEQPARTSTLSASFCSQLIIVFRILTLLINSGLRLRMHTRTVSPAVLHHTQSRRRIETMISFHLTFLRQYRLLQPFVLCGC